MDEDSEEGSGGEPIKQKEPAILEEGEVCKYILVESNVCCSIVYLIKTNVLM